MSNSKIQAILNSDLEKLLEQTNQLHDFLAGNAKCAVCGQPISEDNLSMLIPKRVNDAIHFEFICDNLNCTSNNE